jgi:hypothetical protein
MGLMGGFGAMCAILLATPTLVVAQPDAPRELITVRVVGVLQTGIVAIGGETTGTTITARDTTLELDFGQNEAMRGEADRLDGKLAIVEGSLQRRPGVEIRDRWIVTVERLAPATAEAEGDAPDRPESDQPDADRSDGDQPDGDRPDADQPERDRPNSDTPEGDQADGDRADGDRPNATPRLRAMVRRADSAVDFHVEDGEVIVDVRSEFGIDTATIQRTGDAWPARIVVRLHLTGLESLQVTSGATTLEASLSSTGDPVSRVSLREGNNETSLDPASPYWTEVRIVGNDRTIPLESGHFEVRLPEKLFETNVAEITLQWVDFFRN